MWHHNVAIMLPEESVVRSAFFVIYDSVLFAMK